MSTSEPTTEAVVSLHRADGPDGRVPEVTDIRIGPATISDLHEDAGVDEPTPELFAEEGQRLYEALRAALPMPVLDYLLFHMLADRLMRPGTFEATQ